MLKQTQYTLLFFLLLFMSSVVKAESDPLPNWAKGDNKRAIIDFVTAVSDPQSPDFVPQEERIATFDMDGTLVVEKPEAAVVEFSHYSVAKMKKAQLDTEEKKKLYEAYHKQDETYLQAHIIQLLTLPYAGMTPAEYRKEVFEFSQTAKHPRYNIPYGDLFYAPMLELIAYLHANQFRVFIFSGSDQSFVRGFAKKPAVLLNCNMMGAQNKLNYENGQVVRTNQFRSLGIVGDGKPIGISYVVGNQPILAFGNTDGDQQMLEYASSNPHRHLALWLDHDDAEREYVYDGGVKPEPNWLKVSMKKDFVIIFEK